MVVLLGLLLSTISPAWAFPPAPYYTIYGDVRDAYGDLIPAGDASVILYQGDKEILRERLTNPGQADHNYQLRLRIDMMRVATGSYSSIALRPDDAFTIAINVGGQLFYPLEIAQAPVVGNPAERRRLDLTLGVDSDGDGLPDSWEESQLHIAGYQPGLDGWDLSLIDRDSDFNNDGISNWADYTAGTYTDDHTTTLELKVKEIGSEYMRLEFYAIFGRIYRLEASSDLVTWTPLPFAVSAAEQDTATNTTLRSETTGVTNVYVSRSNSFFRLISR
ncbi:hypothetical protein [Pelagicoccus sp. SDUM812002]|uniref:hypothetical protein n=1 Tax=Pelagicoccus sp. SDUM812002 TaxID=3041266 RepID=UPI00280FE2AD|nr:hypothetical protein [Pelagicoccus sp. SDUM812002]MDQ8187411.1 hypothetical protein [Pelagicoccus sp. SDUM812002]